MSFGVPLGFGEDGGVGDGQWQVDASTLTGRFVGREDQLGGLEHLLRRELRLLSLPELQ